MIITQPTYLAAFTEAVKRHPDQPALTFLQDGAGEGETWSYAQLDTEAHRVAGQLLTRSAPGSPVLLMANPGLEYVAGFFGCMYAGLIAVPAYPPSPVHGQANMNRLQAVAKSAGVSVGLTTDSLSETLADFAVAGRPMEWVSISKGVPVLEQNIATAAVVAEDVAFLQYTSGSTGDPKGVVVTQGNLFSNTRMIRQKYNMREQQTVVSWLPPYHDMGLIGSLLTPLVLSQTAVFMPPAVFLRRPVRWLQVVSRFRGYISPAPNFAYEACVEKVKDADLAGVDLSCWEIAINGAEPVRASTVERFTERFAEYGFRRTAMRPSYGLAEATLLAAAADSRATILDVDSAALEAGNLVLSDRPGGTHRVVSSGTPPTDAEVRVVDPDSGAPLPDGQIGEIEVTGPHVTHGYWRLPDASQELFQGHRLRTGDLGCIFDGELVVTGRLKEVLIIRGRNYYPHDIELTVEDTNPNLRRNSGAAFTVRHDGHQLLVIVQEANLALIGDPSAAVKRIRGAITSVHGVAPSGVTLIRPGTLAKTSSGKIRRVEVRRMYEGASLPAVWSWRSSRLRGSADLHANPDSIE